MKTVGFQDIFHGFLGRWRIPTAGCAWARLRSVFGSFSHGSWQVGPFVVAAHLDRDIIRSDQVKVGSMADAYLASGLEGDDYELPAWRSQSE